jgi:hypothetical protein
MSKPLYDSPDISLIDYTNTQDRGMPRTYTIDERVIAPKYIENNDAKILLTQLEGVIRESDISTLEGTVGEVDRKFVLKYIEDNIPDASNYTVGLPKDATDDEKIAAITKGLKDRSAVIEAYNNREICEAPYIGNEVEEARGKQEGPDVAKRFKSQYEMVPGVRGRENRGAVKSYKVQRNPKTKLTRIKFL